MITTIITNENDMYGLSNKPLDKADTFIAHKNILYIFPKDFNHPLFNHYNAAVAIPYSLITNIIYNDEYGKELSDYIWYKKGIGKPCPPPSNDSLSEDSYTIIQRNYSVIGEHIYKESVIF